MRKWHRVEADGSVANIENPCLCNFGLSAIAIPLIASTLTSAGVGAATAGTIASVAGPALVHAGLGAGMSGLTGGDPGQGAMMGALSGGMGPMGSALGLTQGVGALNEVANTPQALSEMDNGDIIRRASQSGGIMPGEHTGMGTLERMAASMGGGGMNGILATLAGLAQSSQQQGPTTAPGGATMNHPWNPTGYLNRTSAPQAAPASYYSYGQGPEKSFFQGNALRFSSGGALSRALAAGHYGGGGPAFSTGDGENYVDGEGGGQEDNVPAQLSAGEYVVDATTLSRLGDGNSNEGARKMDEFRRLVAHDSGSNKVVQDNTRSPLEYLRDVA